MLAYVIHITSKSDPS